MDRDYDEWKLELAGKKQVVKTAHGPMRPAGFSRLQMPAERAGSGG
jgi:hypothetical protein